MARRRRRGSQRGFGGWAFLIGVVLAVVLGFIGSLTATWIWVLVVIGLVVGFLNITDKETHAFLMSGAILIIAGAFGQNVLSQVGVLNDVLDALLVIFVPATIIVAIKHVFNLAKD
jgi:hypothetical protein